MLGALFSYQLEQVLLGPVRPEGNPDVQDVAQWMGDLGKELENALETWNVPVSLTIEEALHPRESLLFGPTIYSGEQDTHNVQDVTKRVGFASQALMIVEGGIELTFKEGEDEMARITERWTIELHTGEKPISLADALQELYDFADRYGVSKKAPYNDWPFPEVEKALKNWRGEP
jgi:hypothetical protein